MGTIIDTYGKAPKCEINFSVKFESPIIKFHVRDDSCILLLENGTLLFGGNIVRNLYPLIPPGRSLSHIRDEGNLEHAVQTAIPVMESIRYFQIGSDDDYLAVVKNA